MSDLKKLKLDELIYLAKHITYIPPTSEYSKWTDDEILFHALYIGLQNQSQIDTIQMACEICPPVKLMAKERIRRYLKYFMKS